MTLNWSRTILLPRSLHSRVERSRDTGRPLFKKSPYTPCKKMRKVYQTLDAAATGAWPDLKRSSRRSHRDLWYHRGTRASTEAWICRRAAASFNQSAAANRRPASRLRMRWVNRTPNSLPTPVVGGGR